MNKFNFSLRSYLIACVLYFSFSLSSTGQLTSGSRAVFLENLPELPANIWSGQFSSHSRHQRNADVGWFLYTDDNGDAVIFDAYGPGCIKNMWGTDLDKSAVLKFYFDGETKPGYEIGLLDFYNGTNPLFPKPLVSYEKRGYWGNQPFAGNSFVPIPFAKSLKIAVKGKPTFYHILYEKYPYGTKTNTFSGKEDRGYLLESINKIGTNPWNGNTNVKDTLIEKFSPNSTLRVFDRNGKGTIKSIEIEADGSEDVFQNVFLRIRFDENRFFNVNAPLGFFFGSPYEPIDMKSLPFSVEKLPNGKAKLACYFPMPFWRNASVMLVSKSSNNLGSIKFRIVYDSNTYPEDKTGYFTAFYHNGLTEYGRDWLFYESPGTGWYVGAVQASYQEHYCEGNEHFYIDENMTPQINGTGTEDYYLACFWPNVNFNTPFAGSVGDVRILNGGNPSGDYRIPGRYYRFHLDMPIPFYNSVDARIQHGARSDIESKYGSIAFVYLRSRPALYKTDYIDVANKANAGFHGYKSSGNFRGATLDAQYEGNYSNTTIRDSGLYHTGGQITFRIALDENNKGVRLRRRSDQNSGRQKAEVFVNGKYAGTWYDPQTNDILRWYDSEFDIHPDFTKNKESAEIKLKIINENNSVNFTDFEYQVYCFE